MPVLDCYDATADLDTLAGLLAEQAAGVGLFDAEALEAAIEEAVEIIHMRRDEPDAAMFPALTPGMAVCSCDCGGLLLGERERWRKAYAPYSLLDGLPPLPAGYERRVGRLVPICPECASDEGE